MTTRVTTSRLSLVEQRQIEALKLWLASLEDMILLGLRVTDPEVAAKVDVPDWVRECSRRLESTLFAAINEKFAEAVFTPYRIGYALGLMRWGSETFNEPAKPEIIRLVKKRRMSALAKRTAGKLIQSFVIKHDLHPLVNRSKSNFIPPDFRARMRKLDTSGGADSAEYHRGLSDGLRGIGQGAPGEKETLATDLYLTMLMWWRFVARFHSVTELHLWLTRVLGSQRVGDKKRIEKICERIGLTLRERGRPRENPTLALPA